MALPPILHNEKEIIVGLKEIESKIISQISATVKELKESCEIQELILAFINTNVSILSKTYSMHYFPPYICDGVRMPGKWEPDFNLIETKRLKVDCRKFYERIFDNYGITHEYVTKMVYDMGLHKPIHWLGHHHVRYSTVNMKFVSIITKLNEMRSNYVKDFSTPLYEKILQTATEECRPAYEKLLESHRKAEEEKRWKEEERKALIMARAMLQAQAEAAATPPSAPPAPSLTPSTEDPR